MADIEDPSPPGPAAKAIALPKQDISESETGPSDHAAATTPMVSKMSPISSLASKSTLEIVPKLGANLIPVSLQPPMTTTPTSPTKFQATKLSPHNAPDSETTKPVTPPTCTVSEEANPKVEMPKHVSPATPEAETAIPARAEGAPKSAIVVATAKAEPAPTASPSLPVKLEPALPVNSKPEPVVPVSPMPEEDLAKPEQAKVDQVETTEKQADPSPARPPPAAIAEARPAVPPPAAAAEARPAVPPPAAAADTRPAIPPPAAAADTRPAIPPPAAAADTRPAIPPPAATADTQPAIPPPAAAAEARPAIPPTASVQVSAKPAEGVAITKTTATAKESPKEPAVSTMEENENLEPVTLKSTAVVEALSSVGELAEVVNSRSARGSVDPTVLTKSAMVPAAEDDKADSAMMRKRDAFIEDLDDEVVMHVPKQEPVTEEGHPAEISKASIRKRIWDYLEANNLANFPRPVHNRIPNFKGAAAAGDMAVTLEVFKRAQTVKINPDKPQEQCRFLTLESHKNLLVPTPRLRQGLFNRINVPEGANKDMLKLCSTSQGIKEHSSPISLDSPVNIDLIIVGSVAVSRKGYRIGKGEGFADLEFGMMRAMEAVDENIIVVTTVHESQIEDIPDHLMQPHDLTVDYIVTPDNIFPCERRPKPTGIIWSMLTKEKLSRVPILKKLRERQREAGIDVTLRDGEEPEASESNQEDQDRPRQRDRRRRRRNTRRRDSEKGDGEKPEGDRGEHSGDNGEEKDGRRRERRNTRRRRRRSTRKSDGEGGEGSECENGPESGGDGDKENVGDDRRRRPQRRRRRRSAKSHDGEGQSGEDERRDRDRDGENPKQPRERAPRKRQTSGPLATVYVGALPRSLRVSEFKAQVRDKGINPLRVIWHGASGHAFLQFQKKDEADSALASLHEHEIDGNPIIVEMSKRGVRSNNQDENGMGHQENGHNNLLSVQDDEKEAAPLSGEQ